MNKERKKQKYTKNKRLKEEVALHLMNNQSNYWTESSWKCGSTQDKNSNNSTDLAQVCMTFKMNLWQIYQLL